MPVKLPAPKKKAAKTLPAEGTLREEQLINIAAELFARKGYEGTSLRDIAEVAGITKAALYYWFPEKDQLFQRVVTDRMTTLLNHVTQEVSQASTPIEKIRRFLLSSAELMDVDRFGWVTSANTFWSNFDPAQRKKVVPLRDRFERLLRKSVADAMAEGSLREADPAIATRLMLSGLNDLPRWHKKKGRLSAVQVVEQYLDVVLEGLEHH